MESMVDSDLMSVLFAIVLTAFVSACQHGSDPPRTEPPTHRLKAGDQVTIEIFELQVSLDEPIPRRVDRRGYLSVPILGSIYVAGLSKRQFAADLRRRIMEKEILQDPTVTVGIGLRDGAKITVPERAADDIEWDEIQTTEQLIETLTQ